MPGSNKRSSASSRRRNQARRIRRSQRSPRGEAARTNQPLASAASRGTRCPSRGSRARKTVLAAITPAVALGRPVCMALSSGDKIAVVAVPVALEELLRIVLPLQAEEVRELRIDGKQLIARGVAM